MTNNAGWYSALPARQRPPFVPARAVALLLLLIFGGAFLGVGLSDLSNAHGVRVLAVVLGFEDARPGHGPSHSLLVGFRTASGQQEQGVLHVPNPASSYPMFSVITVAYEPSHPSVVAPPKASPGGGWALIALGSVLLLMTPAALVTYLLRRSRKRPSQVPAANADWYPALSSARRSPLISARVIIGMLFFLIAGGACLGVGLSDLSNAADGVRVQAAVLGYEHLPGQGRSHSHTLLVAYRTASGQQEQGLLHVPNPASSYPVFTVITVAYEPSHPSVVALPKASPGGGWALIALGSVLLLMIPAALVTYLLRRARKRPSPLPAASDAS